MALSLELMPGPLTGWPLVATGLTGDNGWALGWSLFWFLVWLASVCGGISLIHVLLTLPMRRIERARLFLDLVETALHRGQPVEPMLVSLSAARDQTAGVRFHLLAAHLRGGVRLGAALERVPRLLPPQVAAVLRAGDRLGDLKRVLPACREILRERPVAVQSAMHYMLLLVVFFAPVAVFIITAIMLFVVPRFKEVAAGMGVALPPLTRFVFAHGLTLAGFEAGLFFVLAVTAVVYVGGPRFVRVFQFRGFPLVDWVAWRVPWKRKRLQRTFSALLAVLLDGGVPEAEAVRLACECTANALCRRRAQQVIAALQRGLKLENAARALDDGGEFQWRLANATGGRADFLGTLRGWHEALDAKAFQQEEATAHAITSGLVILNGLLVALITTSIFGLLVAVLHSQLR